MSTVECQNYPTDLLRKTSGSDNNCSVNLQIGNRKRRPRVGLRGKGHSLASRLEARTVRQPSGCWEIQGYQTRFGYVQISNGERLIYAHRAAWELSNGPIPDGQSICHRCDNPRCVNTSHLFLGTQADNMHDAVNKGRKNCFGRQKLNASQVLDIYARAAAGELQASIAARYGIKRHSVSTIVNGKSWRHLFAQRNLKGARLALQQEGQPFHSSQAVRDLHVSESTQNLSADHHNTVVMGAN